MGMEELGKRKTIRFQNADPYSTKFNRFKIHFDVEKILQQGIRKKYMAISLQ
jgi:hypothetical protein